MRKQIKIWTTRDRQKIRICDMTDSHLQNTIKMMRRHLEQYRLKGLTSAYSTSDFLQGEAAIDSVESNICQLEDFWDEWEQCPILEKLETEAIRRGLCFRKKGE